MAAQRASSLDEIAQGEAARSNNSSSPAVEPAAAAAAAAPAAPAVEDTQDSRSTSSASSPLPAEYEESDFYLNGNDSQSSLGVPNLQDMQVTDEYECLPPVQRLPNEILICIFSKLSASSDLLNVMLTCKRWSRNAVDLLWHRPACTSWTKYEMVCNTLSLQQPYYYYPDFIKRLNLAQLSGEVSDGSVLPLAVCNRVERLTLTGCKKLADTGLIALTTNSSHLMALDISGDQEVTEESIKVIAEHCKRLQGLNISNCIKISSESLVTLAENCRYLKRLKLNDCTQITDEAVLAFAANCPNILEIDLQQCRLIGNAPVTSLLVKGQSLRELRLANCELVDDSAFLALPPGRRFEHLRIIDLTSCVRVTDRTVEKIIEAAPRLRNVVLAKCRQITDQAVFAIASLGKNLHYVHLGHCVNVTDEAVKRLVQYCNRIRYIDLGCCVHLTDESITRLAILPKIKRIGLVKCNNITDASVYKLALANAKIRKHPDSNARLEHLYPSTSSLERVHLSYCTQLTLKSIMKLLNSCPRLTHLSLTGVQAFLRHDLEQFCRDAPPEFTDHQRNVFCVFSGTGVASLRHHLNTNAAFAHLRDGSSLSAQHRAPVFDTPNVPPAGHGHDTTFDEPERDALDDDDGLDDGTEMVIDTTPPAQSNGTSLDAIIIPPPPPAPAAPFQNPNMAYQWNPESQPWFPAAHPHSAPPVSNGFMFQAQTGYVSHPAGQTHGHPTDAMDVTPTQTYASTASTGAVHGSGPSTASLTSTPIATRASSRPHPSHGPSNGSGHGDSSSSSPDAS